jgi:hypothetical protein
MCRNIKTLHNFAPPATEEEIHASALQFVRKVSGFTKPSQANEAIFDQAVTDVAEIVHALLDQLVTNAPARDREVEKRKAHARYARRAAALQDVA